MRDVTACVHAMYSIYVYSTLQECTNPCCNANTCQLAAGAVCAAGTCCTDTCQFRPYGTTCRPSNRECDIIEFCQGDSASCPVDTYRRDGSTCNNGNDYCFDGACETYDSQCQFHFSEFMFMAGEEGEGEGERGREGEAGEAGALQYWHSHIPKKCVILLLKGPHVSICVH